jgi:hypothetical protein
MNKLLCLVVVLFAVSVSAVKYKAQFVGVWNAENTVDIPADASFSDLVLVTHNDQYAPWQEDEMASAGFAEYASSGNTNALMDEIEQAISLSQAFDYKDVSGMLGTERTHFSFMANESFPFLTIAARLNPSPDWFTGFASKRLVNSKGEWVKRASMKLMVYTAGVDAGKNFTDSSPLTEPKDISPLKTSWTKKLKFIARFRLVLVQCSQYMDQDSCAAYNCRWVDEVQACRTNFDMQKPWVLSG